MLSFKEVNELLEKNHNEIKELKVQYEQNEKEYLAMMDGMSLKEKFEYRKSNREVFDKKIKLNGILEDQINDLRIERKILLNNAYVTLFNEVMPATMEILKKYKGKPYGEKTKEKICTEVMEKTNFRLYIYEKEYNFYHVENQYKFEVFTEKYSDLLSDNKIQIVPLKELRLASKNRYVENTKERVEELKVAYDKLVQAKKQLENLCNEFNELSVNGIETLSVYNTNNIRNKLTV